MSNLSLGKLIKDSRKKKGFNLAFVAASVGLSNPSYLCQIESESKDPSLNILKKLAVVLEIPTEQVLSAYVQNELNKIGPMMGAESLAQSAKTNESAFVS